MVNHHVVGLHIAVHDAHAVTVVESLQKFIQVEPNIIIGQSLIELFEVGVIHVFKYK